MNLKKQVVRFLQWMAGSEIAQTDLLLKYYESRYPEWTSLISPEGTTEVSETMTSHQVMLRLRKIVRKRKKLRMSVTELLATKNTKIFKRNCRLLSRVFRGKKSSVAPWWNFLWKIQGCKNDDSEKWIIGIGLNDGQRKKKRDSGSRSDSSVRERNLQSSR